MIKFSEFIEQVMGIELLEYQRLYADAFYDAYKNAGHLTIAMLRNNGKYDFRMLMASMMAIYERSNNEN